MSDSDSSNDAEALQKEAPVRKKKLRDYLEEKAARLAAEQKQQNEWSEYEDRVALPGINPVNYIKNKDVRRIKYKRLQVAKKKEEKAARKERRQQPGPKDPGHTIESLREADQTTVTATEGEELVELQKDLETDEFSEYFNRSYEPKVLISYSDNPHTKTRKFGKELGEKREGIWAVFLTSLITIVSF